MSVDYHYVLIPNYSPSWQLEELCGMEKIRSQFRKIITLMQRFRVQGLYKLHYNLISGTSNLPISIQP